MADKLTLYHGSNVIVKNPKVLTNGFYKDFGYGFYCTKGEAELRHLISVANVLHSVNPMQVEADWITEYNLQQGTFDITAVDKNLCEQIPAATAMGKVYMRLILATLQPDEDYVQGMRRVYNNPICEVIDNYNASAYYEPSYVIARAYNDGGF